MTSPSNAVALTSLVVTLLAIEELNEVDEPEITESVTSNVISLALTAVVIGPLPVNVKVSVEAIASAVPESASTLNVVLIPAMSEAILAEVAVKDPDIAVFLPAEAVKSFKFHKYET